MPEYLVNLNNIIRVHRAGGCSDARRYGPGSTEHKPWWQPLGEYADVQLAVESVPERFDIPEGMAAVACQSENCPN